ncbi:GNAT family N-acetyltransferase [Pedobacter endophyticus]|nr:GNAT family N-acetyltransferase [Pedobacter endophyticus]
MLRKIEENDLEDIYRGLSNPEVIKYYGIHYDSLPETLKQLQWFKALEENKTGIWWAICDKNDGHFIGAIGFNNLSNQHKKIEIGFWLLPKFWGKGLIHEAAEVICNYAFDDLGINRIEAFVESENNNSKKALAKLLFEYEGTMKSCEIKNGKFISLAIYAKLNHRTSVSRKTT